MKNVTAQQLLDLRNAPFVYYLIEFDIGSTTYRFTNLDYSVTFNSQVYTPGLFDEIQDIEITAAPKTNDINVTLHDADNSIQTLLLTQSYMNKTFKIIKVFNNEDNEIMSINAFEGLISDYELNIDQSEVELTVSSVWADSDKISGIKTNAKSQQRFYPVDTAFEWAALAQDKIYWGRRAPSQNSEPPAVVTPPFQDEIQ